MRLRPSGPTACTRMACSEQRSTTAPIRSRLPIQRKGVRGDRVPPGGSFTYRWSVLDTCLSACVWLYHDHGPAHDHSLMLGAFGVLRILAPGEQPADLPPGPVRGA